MFLNGCRYPGDLKGAPSEVYNCRCTTVGHVKGYEKYHVRGKYGNGKLGDESYDEWKARHKAALEKSSNSGRNTLTNGGGNDIILTKAQRGKKFGEHCKDWGLDPTKPEDRYKLKKIVKDIFYNKTETRIGPYSGQPDDVLFYIKGKNVVETKQNNEFITVLKGGISSGRVKNARKL